MEKSCLRFFYFSAIAVAVFFSFSLPRAYAEVSKISFTTEPQHIGVGEISGPITVQVQDVSGAEQKADETIYLSFSSTLNGEFSSNKDNWIPITEPKKVYISTNSSNRTFYYKGLSQGEHNLFVAAVSKSGKTWDLSQIIYIGVGPVSTAFSSVVCRLLHNSECLSSA
jgi:hypothetical protein